MRDEKLSSQQSCSDYQRLYLLKFANRSIQLAVGLVVLLVAGQVMAVQSADQFPDTSAIEEMGIDPNTLSQQQIQDILATQSQRASVSPRIEEVNDENVIEPNRLERMAPKQSAIEKLLSAELSGMVPNKLVQFGYDVFQKPASTFAPVTNVPVGPDYIIGPGDAFTITLWGRTNAQYTVEVNRNGGIVLPEVGVLNVAGMTFAAMQDYIQDQLARKQTDFKMAITMGRLRTIKVFVVGEARTPGSYTVSSLSTVINALFAAGGPSKNGSLRDIRLSRSNQQPRQIDLYKFLLGGDKNDDVRLQDGDTIFIPIIGPVVGVAGNVKRPAIYEMAKPTTLREVLDFAGGVNYAGWLRQVQISRVENHQRRVVVDFNVAPSTSLGTSEAGSVVDQSAADTVIQDGDVVKVFGVSPLEQGKRSATIAGEVYRPGEYRFVPGMRLSELLDAAGGPRKNAYLKDAELTRRHIDQTGMQTEKIDIDLEKALAKDPTQDIELQDYDHLIVRLIPQLEFDRIAIITGEVRFPGVYPISKGDTLSSLIERAGGFTDRAYLRGAVFTRESAKVIQKQRMDELINKIEESTLTSAGKEISGAIDAETAQAYAEGLNAKKELLAKLRTSKIDGRVVVKLSPLDQFRGSRYDVEMEKGDTLFVPQTPGIISVVGEVFNPISVLYEKDRTVAYYLQKVGGPTDDADKKQISIIKADGSVVSIAQKNADSVYWDSEGHQWNFGGFMGIRLNPGDTILVPKKMDKLMWLKNTKDITQILFQAALATGVVLAL
jgi:protein involved in polysaccharide export with SLBB domain